MLKISNTVKISLCLFISALCIFATGCSNQAAVPASQNLQAETQIAGTWESTLYSSNGTPIADTSVKMVFKTDKTYEITEKDANGKTSTVQGTYQIMTESDGKNYLKLDSNGVKSSVQVIVGSDTLITIGTSGNQMTSKKVS